MQYLICQKKYPANSPQYFFYLFIKKQMQYGKKTSYAWQDQT
jgi:hypothetical protein